MFSNKLFECIDETSQINLYYGITCIVCDFIRGRFTSRLETLKGIVNHKGTLIQLKGSTISSQHYLPDIKSFL